MLIFFQVSMLLFKLWIVSIFLLCFQDYNIPYGGMHEKMSPLKKSGICEICWLPVGKDTDEDNKYFHELES